MYLTPRSAQVRNVSVAMINGAITLVILLIAPLGLVAVVINTLLVTAATYLTATAADRIVLFLQGDSRQRVTFLGRSRSSQIQRTESEDIERQ